MLKNYLKIAFRNIVKNRTFSLINISGLSLGLACCILISLYVINELSYDKYNNKVDKIFRVKYSLKLNGITYNEASIPFPAAGVLKSDYPEVENAVRLYKNTEPTLIRYNDNKYLEEKFFFADKSIFNIFDFKFIDGNPESAFNDPASVVITKSTAEKYFGNENPLNKILKYENNSVLKVTGIIEDVSSTSHFSFDFIAPLDFQLNAWESTNSLNGREKQWFWTGSWTYLLLKSATSYKELNTKFPTFVKKYFPDRIKGGITLGLQPLKDIHLYSNLENEIKPNSSVIYIYIFSVIAFFVLLIACMNFINLTTAKSLKRIKEVGIRKTLGATKTSLLYQMFIETAISVLISLLFAFGLVELFLPQFNNITGVKSGLFLIGFSDWTFFVLTILFIVTLLSGIYPAFFISKFNPASSIKGAYQVKPSKNYLRKAVVVAQFSISIALMIGVLIIVQQLKYIQNKKLGFDKKDIVCIKAHSEVTSKFETFKEDLLQNPSIKSVSTTSNIPGEGFYTYRFVPEGKTIEKPVVLPLLNVDYDFLKTLSIKVILGRNFSKEYPSDGSTAFLVNQEALKELGWEKDPLGKRISLFAAGTNEIEKSGKVIGVIDDVIYESLHQAVKPIVLTLGGYTESYLVKYSNGNENGVINYLQQRWNDFASDWPIEYSFLESNLTKNYKSENNLQTIVNYFTLFAFFITCFGLFGLASFTAEQRTKEIGIRKVLGATISNIVLMLSSEFLILVAVANIVAWPIAYYIMSKWLEYFAYKTNLSIGVFLIAGFLVLIIALLTVSFQAIKAATANPVRSLRYE